ncbi:hypothetical protein ACFO5O_04535 [Geojedonia litorea]|uniref:Uncharacterized protein n=1 Tax=Geojedonia litorea TaxID=1268269 RepID=A0ABV9N461_9FLAO
MKKTTPKNYSKKLSQYGALTAAITGIADASGQVVYTPLGTTHADAATYALDMNNEAPNEFEFNQAGNNLFVQPTSVNAAILGSSSSGFIYPFALNSGVMVSSAQATWFPADPLGSQILNFQNCGFYNSDWCNPTTDKFLGLRFSISGQIHYGWARVSVYNLPSSGNYPRFRLGDHRLCL